MIAASTASSLSREWTGGVRRSGGRLSQVSRYRGFARCGWEQVVGWGNVGSHGGVRGSGHAVAPARSDGGRLLSVRRWLWLDGARLPGGRRSAIRLRR